MPIVLESRKEHYDEGLTSAEDRSQHYKLSEWGGEISI